jgi:hypothetical protein
MLEKDYVKQPQMKEHVQNSLEERMQEIGLGEGQFVQNRIRIHNSPNVNRAKPFSIRLDSIPHRVQMNVVQMEARLSREFTPSSRMPRMMNGIPQILIIVS